MSTRQALLVLALVLAPALLTAPPARAAGPPALEPPPPAELREARAIVERMQAADRGPYRRLRWYCADGVVLPPDPYACREHGGGRQHGEYSEDRDRLSAIGYRVGTVVAALSWEELWDEEHRHDRLRELSLERYLSDVDDGWVMRRARGYRGHVQVEDEERVGGELLVALLSRPEWIARGTNWLLALETVRILPHRAGAVDRTREARRLSAALAEADESFLPLRIRIHSDPGPEALAATRAWTAARRENLPPATLELALQVEKSLAALFGEGRLRRRLDAAAQGLRQARVRGKVIGLAAGLESADRAERVARLSELVELVREEASLGGDGRDNLLLADLSIEALPVLRSEALGLLEREDASRAELLQLAGRLVSAAHGAGLLTPGEKAALRLRLDELAGSGSVPTAAYRRATRALERAGAWSIASVRHAFAEPLERYAALEPVAARFPDDLIRSSVMVPLATLAGRLARDAERLDGLSHRLAGSGAEGAAGLNPGLAFGPLLVLDQAGLRRIESVPEEAIVVLPRTVPELPPVAGILSLAEGNVVSHVQVLARNLGIPNASLPSGSLESLRGLDGRRVLFAVSGQGAVVLVPEAELPASIRQGLEAGGDGSETSEAVEAPTPDLSVTKPLRLSELDASLSGRVVGPKAANLGELARSFPEAVAPAVALPFGLFAEHARSGADPPKARLDRAFTAFRSGRLDSAGLMREVEAVRESVAALRLEPTARLALERALRETMGGSGEFGVFVRSDTNVEDLPGFTGAGLNETLPNVVGIERILAGIPRVWASPFRERAMRWRARALSNPEEVYPSVLLMRSVPADKSGVLVTRDLVGGGEGLTVATAWGVGGAVDGETAETLVLRPDGEVELVSQAKAPWKRRLPASGGVDWVPAEAGAVLTAGEQQRLRELAASLPERLPASLSASGALDVEFGFVGGRLALFQVRPLVERGAARADSLVAELVPRRQRVTAQVALDRPPEAAR